VLASSGDFYAHRRHGVIVYDGIVQRVHSKYLETCYIDDKGDMLFSYAGELPDEKSAQKFVDDNNIRFSVAFGPVLVENGVPRPHHEYTDYLMGSVNGDYSRIALCQRDDLHYFIAIAGQDSSYNCYRLITLAEFQKHIVEFGCKMAYTMDGGQTATMVLNDQLMNRPSYDSERDISDIIYFATAIPNGE
jgi:exopolysaccharide biosynthesis protein